MRPTAPACQSETSDAPVPVSALTLELSTISIEAWSLASTVTTPSSAR